MTKPLAASVLAVEAQLIRDGLSAADARNVVTVTAKRTALIERRLKGKDISAFSHHVAAVADDLRHGG